MKYRVMLIIALAGLSLGPVAAQTPASRAAGVQAFKSADYNRAITLFKKAVKENENDAISWYMLGSAYLKRGKNKDGVKALERAVKIDPKNELNLAGLAFAYMLTQNSKAQETARGVIALNPKNVDAHYVLGQIALLDSSYNVAYQRANRVIELDPDHAAAYRLKGEALLGSFAAQGGTIIKPPADRNSLFVEASAEFDKYLSLVKDEAVRKEISDQLESLKAFAEYFAKKDADIDAPALNSAPEPGKVPLKILSKPRPSYTDGARDSNLQGTVVVLVVFKSDGKVGSVLVVKGIGGGLDQQSVSAARKIKFIPASKDGKTISVVRKVEYTFSIG